MEVPIVLQHVGKLVRLVLSNSYNYTCVIPPKEQWPGVKSFVIIDKFGQEVIIDCECIMVINRLKDGWGNTR